MCNSYSHTCTHTCCHTHGLSLPQRTLTVLVIGIPLLLGWLAWIEVKVLCSFSWWYKPQMFHCVSWLSFLTSPTSQWHSMSQSHIVGVCYLLDQGETMTNRDSQRYKKHWLWKSDIRFFVWYQRMHWSQGPSLGSGRRSKSPWLTPDFPSALHRGHLSLSTYKTDGTVYH